MTDNDTPPESPSAKKYRALSQKGSHAMIPIPATLKFWILFGIVGGLGALKAIQPLEPTWAWVTSVIQVLGFVEAFFTQPTSKVQS